MAGYLLQQDWTEKPPSGTPLRRDGHWSVQGLDGCWAFNEGGGSATINSVTSGRALFSGDVTFNALGAKINTSSSYILTDIQASIAAGTVFCVAKENTNKANAEYIFGTSAANRRYLLRPGGGDLIQWRSGNGAAIGTISIPNGSIFTAAGIWSENSTNYSLYVNGKFSAAGTSTANTSAVTQTTIGAVNLNAFAWGDSVILTALYFRTLSASEIASLSANPWQVFEPRTIWVEVGGAGGTDLTFNATSTSISTSLYSPSIVGSATTLVSGATNSTFNLIDPTVSSGSSIAVTPAVLAALFGIIDPSVSGSSLVAPSAQNVVVTQIAPSISGSASILTSVQNAAFAQVLANVSGSSLSQVNAVASLLNVLSPLVDLGGNALITPAVLSAVFNAQDPSVYFDNKFAVGVVGSILGSNSPIIIGDASVAPSVIEAIVSAVTPVLRGDSAYSASVVNSVYSAVQPLANLGVTISVNINGATFAVNPVTFSDGSIVVNAGAQNVSVNILTPIINKVGRVVMVIKGGSPSVSLFGRSGSLTIQ